MTENKFTHIYKQQLHAGADEGAIAEYWSGESGDACGAAVRGAEGREFRRSFG